MCLYVRSVLSRLVGVLLKGGLRLVTYHPHIQIFPEEANPTGGPMERCGAGKLQSGLVWDFFFFFILKWTCLVPIMMVC